MAEIQLKHVTKIYEGGSAAVRDFNLEIHERGVCDLRGTIRMWENPRHLE